ncbi:MAG: hypothetical protein ACHQ4H_17690 [Ktedonobacterales bacterium]
MRRSVLLSTLLVGVLATLGCLGGFVGASLKPLAYSAEAYVVVYEMPAGFQQLIGPDEANQIEGVYRAGALQDSVVNRVVATVPGLTPSDVRQSVQVTIVAYSPLTRVAATAADPQRAAQIANAVATTWASQAAHSYNTAYTIVSQQLTSREAAIDRQITATQAAITTAGQATVPDANHIKGLQSQLTAELQERTNLDNQITSLDVYRLQVLGNGYVATPANPANVTVTPDRLKATALGGAIGLALGLALGVWLIRSDVVAAVKRSDEQSDASALEGAW